MKSNLYPFDKRLYELFQREEYRKFTTRELRDGYAQYLSEKSFLLTDVRRYVYEQIRRMLRLGWLTLDEERKRFGQVYHLRPMPNSLKLRLVDNGFESNFNIDPEQEQAVHPPLPETHFTVTARQLERRLKETRLDFLSSVGEAEGYKLILDDMPQLKNQIEDDYLEARDRSSRLLGHVRAIEKTLKNLEILA
ncbi:MULTISPECIES: hypothetical protein [Oceanisphaera]|uniref:Response regulator n=1 Tax=Oceanisphaera ostreae TaxID=914151 RepID=A0ABW3KHJ0_9GAMM